MTREEQTKETLKTLATEEAHKWADGVKEEFKHAMILIC